MIKTERSTTDLEDAVYESVQEALLLAEFFRKAHQDAKGEILGLSSISVTSEQLELAQEYLEQPVSIEVFAKSLENMRRPRVT